ncbi:TPA: CRISPR-associated endonuclease Cas2 [Pasteurella multocida]|uniref:CRISPR-associated endonuclease Cas2 n=1 Tax=Pasteurella multocida TaxID=747 RepID=UPI00397C9036
MGYDISDEKRLVRIHKVMLKYATPIQYSVFLFEGIPSRLEACVKEVFALMHKKEDDVRIYPIPNRGKQWIMGKRALPEGIIWTALPHYLLSTSDVR